MVQYLNYTVFYNDQLFFLDHLKRLFLINLYIILFTLSIIYCQFPIELNKDQSYNDTIEINQDGLYRIPMDSLYAINPGLIDVQLETFRLYNKDIEQMIDIDSSLGIIFFGEHARPFIDAEYDYNLYKNTQMDPSLSYGLSKAGVIQFTKLIASKLGPKIRVNSISPGGIKRKQNKKFIER